jgi:hypothetical protein
MDGIVLRLVEVNGCAESWAGLGGREGNLRVWARRGLGEATLGCCGEVHGWKVGQDGFVS